MAADDITFFAPSGDKPRSAPAAPVADDIRFGVPLEEERAARPVRGATTPDERELTWGETARGAAKELLPSTGRMLADIGHAVTSPKETAGAVASLGKGAVSKVKGALGTEQEPGKKAQDEEILDALLRHYTETYGSVKGFKKAAATDPASILMDVTTPLSGLPGKAGALARLANPVEDAVRLAKGAATSVAAPVARGLARSTSGVPVALQKVATAAGRVTTPAALRAAFTKFSSGTADAGDLFTTTQQAMRTLADDASTEFAASKAGQAAAARTPTFNQVDQAIIDAENDIRIGRRSSPVAFRTQSKILDDIKQLVAHMKADPASHNFIDFDKMKRAIRQIGSDYGDTSGGSPATKVANAVKAELSTISPEYVDLMESWQRHINDMNDLSKALGQSRGTAASSALAKLLRASKTPRGENLIDKLSAVEPSIPFMLAGSAMHPLTRGDFIGEMAKFGGIGAVMANPALLPHIAAGALASSPRAVGVVNKAAGRLERPIAAATSGPALYAASTAALAGQPVEPGAQQKPVSETPDALEPARLQAESGAQQTDRSGAPVTSPKGAIGIAQIMPETGPEAAALAGEKWDLNRLKTDADYNRKLGRAYFAKQMADFGGDPVAALAAYNAGPGAVRRAMSTASARGGNFLAYLPAETQGYVRKVLGGGPVGAAAAGGRIQRASGGRTTKMNHNAEAKRLVHAAERAREAHGKRTEPLLNKHDDAVATALAVANRAI